MKQEITKEDLAQRMRNFRYKNRAPGHLTQAAAAHILGLSKRTIENIEAGNGFQNQRVLLLAMAAANKGLGEYE